MVSGKRICSCLPTDHTTRRVIIKDNTYLPRSHIALSQTCHDARQAYSRAGTWKQLCMVLGIGRSLVDQKVSLKQVYIEVVHHQKTCRVPSCYQFGVPGMLLFFIPGVCDAEVRKARDCIGDLLPTLEAVREHYASQNEADDLADDASPSESDPEEKGTTASTAPQSPNRTKPPLPEPVVPHLLPLSKARQNSVPAEPCLHRLLTSCGATNFTAFVRGKFLGAPRIDHSMQQRHLLGVDHSTNERYWRAIDWAQDDDPVDDEPLEYLDDHPLLARAFA